MQTVGAGAGVAVTVTVGAGAGVAVTVTVGAGVGNTVVRSANLNGTLTGAGLEIPNEEKCSTENLKVNGSVPFERKDSYQLWLWLAVTPAFRPTNPSVSRELPNLSTSVYFAERTS